MPAPRNTTQDDRPLRLAIVGGGIAGLAAAVRACRLVLPAEVLLLEGSDTLGGVLRTEHTNRFLIEHSADSFITDQPHALDFCREIGLQNELLPTSPAQRKAFIARGGRLEPIPEGFLLMAPGRIGPILKSRLLSARGKLRLAAERLIPTRGRFDPTTEPELEESLAQFAIRRLGREAFDYLVQPLVSGIYSADPERLSIAATLPRFLQMEQDYGSLTAAMRAKQKLSSNSAAAQAESGARYSMFMAPRLGMSQLVEAAQAKLPSGVVRLNARAESIAPCAEGWQIEVAGQAEPILAESLVLATPADVSARILRSMDGTLADAIESIPLGGCSVVSLGFRRSALEQQPEGFGFVVPAVEKRPILAASYSSEKFPGRAPKNHLLIRVFVGGNGREELANRSDAKLAELALEEITPLLGVREPPVLRRVARWTASMPQYHVGHLALVDRVEKLVARHPGLALAGNAYRGVGVPR